MIGKPRARSLAALALALGLAAGARAEDGVAAGPAVPDGLAPGEATAVTAVSQRSAFHGVEEAWRAPAVALEERVARTRLAALRIGVRNLDAPARALLLDTSLGDPGSRAAGAVALAPDLPDAHLALARVHWSNRDLRPAVAELRTAFVSIPRHLEASLWFDATLSAALALAAWLGGLLYLVAAGLAAAPVVSRHVGSRLQLPAVSRAALVAALLLLPAALGEGLLGIATVCVGLTLFHATLAGRVAAVLATLALLAGVHPLLDRAARDMVTLAPDPVAEAAYGLEHGIPSPMEIGRLEHAEGRDPLADRALALHARRRGDLVDADARYRSLVADPGAPVELVNGAANTSFSMGRTDEAILGYERAAAAGSDPVIFFNLAQAYGRAIRLQEQEQALTRGQALDAALIHDLTEGVGRLGSSVVLDLPPPVDALRSRLTAEDDIELIIASLRQRIAPGWLGRSPQLCIVLLAGLGLVTLLLGIHLGAGGPAFAEDDLYAGIARLLQGREATDPALRVERLKVLRERRARYDRVARIACLVLPGAAGVLARRPLLGLLGAFSFAIAVAGHHARAGVVPDAFAAGATGAFAFGAVSLLAAGLYVLVTGAGTLLREKQ